MGEKFRRILSLRKRVRVRGKGIVCGAWLEPIPEPSTPPRILQKSRRLPRINK